MADEVVAPVETPSIESSPEISQSSDFDIKAASDSIGEELFGKKEVKDDPKPKEPKKEKVEPEVKAEKAEPKTEEKPEEKPPVDDHPLPASWKKDMKATWDSLPKEAKAYVIQREEQMKGGLVKDREDAEIGRFMRDTVKPYEAIMRQNGENPGTVVKNMMSAHYSLKTAPLEQKKQIFQKLAESYGIKFDEQGQSQEIDPIVKNLTSKINRLESYLSSSQEAAEQAARTKVINEVDTFALDHPLIDDPAVANRMSLLMKDPEYSLEQAYKEAVWANSLTRQKELDRLQQERDKKTKEETEKKIAEAKKAKAVNVKTRDTGRTPTAPTGSMFDTIDEVYRDIKQRNRS
jgi:hypothetical protein